MQRYVDDIARCVRQKRAVLFFGAGVSKSAGLPLWNELLELCLKRAEASDDVVLKDSVPWYRQYSSAHDPLLVAEMLQRKVGQDKLSALIQTAIKPFDHVQPSKLHQALADIAWSQILTSNYDQLFDQCYRSDPKVLTWRNADEFLSSIKRNETVIFKLHGSIDIPDSLILTKSEFSAIQYNAPLLNRCVSSLLMTHSFVFVGYSLRDPDLVHLIEGVKKVARDGFGPHYMIMPATEYSKEYASFLADVYGVSVIPLGSESPKDFCWDEYQRDLISYLRDIEGAVLNLDSTNLWSDAVPQHSKLALEPTLLQILKDTIERTHSMRGDICLEEQESNSQLQRVAVWPESPKPEDFVDPDQVIGTVFLNRREKDDYIYLDDVSKAPEILPRLGYSRARYIECDSRVESEIAIPIYSEGRRAGVLNLEAAEKRRFSDGHREYLEKIASQIGWVRSEVTLRMNTASRFKRFFTVEGNQEFTSTLLKRRSIVFAKLDFALFELDYIKGDLIAHSVCGPPESSNLRHKFSGPSLAARVLRDGRSYFEPDAEVAGRNNRLDLRGIQHFNITGPIAGYPIRIKGIIVAVLVAWSRSDPETDLETRTRKFKIGAERAYRICRLLSVKEQENAMTFLDSMDEAAKDFSEEDLKSSRNLQMAGKVDELYEKYLELLLRSQVGLTRLRMWVREPDWRAGERRFVLRHSMSIPQASRDGKAERDRYRGRQTNDESKFTRLTIDRAPHDPYSRRQHKNVFGAADPNCYVLDKNPESEWAVAPLVKGRHVWGFVSAEVDVWNTKISRMDAGRRITDTQHFALDVISHTISSFQPQELNVLWESES